MATLVETARRNAADLAPVRLAPDGDAKQSGAASLRFPAAGAWQAGDYFSVVGDVAFYLVAGDNTVVATTAETGPFPAGVHDFVLPDDATHVAVIAASGTLNATAWQS
jgi:hypothetical protein